MTDVPHFCAHCFKLAYRTRCSACKSVYYCSHLCQKKDWKSHKLVCSQILQNRKQMKTLVNVLVQWNDSYNKKDNFFKILGTFMDTGNAKHEQMKCCEIAKEKSWFKNNENMVPRRTRYSKEFPDGEWIIEQYNKNDEKPESMRFMIFKTFIDNAKFIRGWSCFDYLKFSPIFRLKIRILVELRNKIFDLMKKYPLLSRSTSTSDDLFLGDRTDNQMVNVEPLIPSFVKYRHILCDNIVFCLILEFIGFEDYTQDYFCSIDFTYNAKRKRNKKIIEEKRDRIKDGENNKIVLRTGKNNCRILDECSSINRLVVDGLFDDQEEAEKRIFELRRLKKSKFKKKIEVMKKRKQMKRIIQKEEEESESPDSESYLPPIKSILDQEEVEVFEDKNEKVKVLRNDAIVMGSLMTRTTPSPKSKNQIVFDDGLFLIGVLLNHGYEPTIYHDVSKQNMKTKKRFLTGLKNQRGGGSASSSEADTIFKFLNRLDEEKNSGSSRDISENDELDRNAAEALRRLMMGGNNSRFNVHNVGKGVGVGLNELNLDDDDDDDDDVD